MAMQNTTPDRTYGRGDGWANRQRMDRLTKASYLYSSDASISPANTEAGSDLRVNPWRNISAELEKNSDGETILTVKATHSRFDLSYPYSSNAEDPIFSTFIFKIEGTSVRIFFFTDPMYTTGEAFARNSTDYIIPSLPDKVFYSKNEAAGTATPLTHNTYTAESDRRVTPHNGLFLAAIGIYLNGEEYEIVTPIVNDEFSCIPKGNCTLPLPYKIFHKMDARNDALGAVESGYAEDEFFTFSNDNSNGFAGTEIEKGKIFAVVGGLLNESSPPGLLEVEDTTSIEFDDKIRAEIGEKAFAMGHYIKFGYISISVNGKIEEDTFYLPFLNKTLAPMPGQYLAPEDPGEVDVGPGEYYIDVVTDVNFATETVTKTRLKFYGRQLLSERQL